jgi:hypothetical protein
MNDRLNGRLVFVKYEHEWYIGVIIDDEKSQVRVIAPESAVIEFNCSRGFRYPNFRNPDVVIL